MTEPNDPQFFPWWRFERLFWTPSRAPKIFLGCVLFLPRLCFFLSCIFAYWVTTRIACIGHDPNEPPTSPLRRKILKLGRFFARGTLLGLGFHKITYRGKAPQPSTDGTPLVIVSNHISYCDILFHMSQGYFPAFISKAEVSKFPLVGAIAKAMGCLFVDRLKKDNISYELSRRYFTGKTKYPPIVIFPEGTTSNGKALIQFRKGAFLGGVPVTPIILKYSFSTTNPSDVCTNLGPHVIRMILEPSNHLEVTFLPTYYPSEQEREDPILYTANVRSEMARIGKLPLYDVDYQHKLTYNKLVNFK